MSDLKEAEITFQVVSVEQAEHVLIPMLLMFGYTEDDIEISWGTNPNINGLGVKTPLIKVKAPSVNGISQLKVPLGVFGGFQLVGDLDAEVQGIDIREMILKSANELIERGVDGIYSSTLLR